ncbi:MAG: tetratricopeptide repeat protein [Nitrospirota bacterium]|nr:tetratricopeptide repeat protein [Nitrospirota bacterium]
MTRKNLNFISMIQIGCLLLLFLLLLPSDSSAKEIIYTIQTGSFTSVENAGKQYEALKQEVDSYASHDLRIEKSDSYYQVRIGKFKDRAAADAALNNFLHKFPHAFILKTYLRDENIVKTYGNSDSSDREEKIAVAEEKDAESHELMPQEGEQVVQIDIDTASPESNAGRLVREGKYDEAAEIYRKGIAEALDSKEKAILHKELGDLFVAKEDFKSAGEEFIKALSLSRDFSEPERLQMAIIMSWGGRIEEAIDELRLLLKENDKNIDARIHLARCLSWSGKLDEALEETEKVISESPDNKDALLVKASALSWKGDHKTAIPLYRSILEKGEDFDTRLGLAYALLSSGDRKGAKENAKLLRPEYPYQDRELEKLLVAINRETRSGLEIGYSYYNDTDDNIVNRYFVAYDSWIGNWKIKLNYRHTHADDRQREEKADELLMHAYTRVTDSLGIGGGLGVSLLGNGDSTSFASGYINAERNFLNGAIGARISREVFTETAEIIENRIRATNTLLYITQNLSERLSLYASYSYKDYSDDNNSNDLLFVPKYIIYTGNPKVALGYRFRYLDFNRQSGGGYFDPCNYFSHQLFISLSYEKGKLYGFIEPYVGHQSFTRNGAKDSDYYSGGSGLIGIKITEDISFEANGEAGDYASATAAGFEYYLIGGRLVIKF